MDVPFYIHSLDPVLVEIWGPLAIRWYGLAYVAGFGVGFGLLHRWARQGAIHMAPDAVHTLIFASVIGVMLGGRLGYLLFYDFAAFVRDPLMMFRLWEGGMSSHGGMLGLAGSMGWFAHNQRVPFLHVADALVSVGPIGIFFGRIANFINGELWGRVTSVRWAVLFPQEAGLYPPMAGLREEAVRLYHAGLIQPRHPSQLYAALVEGLLVWAIVMTVRRTAWARQLDGRLSAVFLFAYAAGRIGVEQFRAPEIVHGGWLTQGQLLSVLLLIPALVLILRSSSGRRT